MYSTYVANKTISLPDDVLPIIANLDVPFSTWIADQLRRHAAARPTSILTLQLTADAALAQMPRPTFDESRQALERMDRSAPW
jgi:hypothetical protein